MSAPAPKSGETSKEYIPRCMKAIDHMNAPQDQKLAICYTAFREAKKSLLLNTVKKLFKSLMSKLEQ